MSIEPIVTSISYQRHETPPNAEARFTLVFANMEVRELPLGSVFSLVVNVSPLMTDNLRSETKKKYGSKCDVSGLYVASSMSMSIDNQFIPSDIKTRIKRQKDIASIKITACTVDTEGNTYAKPESDIYFPDIYFRNGESLYEIIDDTSEELMFVYVAPDKALKHLMEESLC